MNSFGLKVGVGMLFKEEKGGYMDDFSAVL